MSLGATMSAPASASDAAVFASRATLESFSTVKCSPSRATMPQWPCEVYSHRQTSAMITSDSAWEDSLIARKPRWTMPSAAHAPLPRSSFSSGIPNSSSPPIPRAAQASTSFTASSMERLKTPGMLLISRARLRPRRETGDRSSAQGCRCVSRTSDRMAAEERRRRRRVAGNSMQTILWLTPICVGNTDHTPRHIRGLCCASAKAAYSIPLMPGASTQSV